MRSPSVREKKSARIKISILSATIEIIGKGSFDTIHVNQICDIAGVSKVTFFKYFPQKEDILLHYFKVWCFHRAVELSIDQKSGIEGIRYLFNSLAKSYTIHPGMFLGLLGYYTKLEMPVKPFPLKLAERQLIYPNVENIDEIDTLSLDQLFENFLLDAIFSKEITKTGDVKKLILLLDTVLYGSIAIAHLKQTDMAPLLFKQNLEQLLSSLRSPETESTSVY
jgi:AcrR family transcriptional regulator